jgi:hypothetical protein
MAAQASQLAALVFSQLAELLWQLLEMRLEPLRSHSRLISPQFLELAAPCVILFFQELHLT